MFLSSLDGRRQLLDVVRQRFPEGTVTLGAKATSREVLDYWHYLQDYRSHTEGQEIKVCLGTSHYGLQDSTDYWFPWPAGKHANIHCIAVVVFLQVCLLGYSFAGLLSMGKH